MKLNSLHLGTGKTSTYVKLVFSLLVLGLSLLPFQQTSAQSVRIEDQLLTAKPKAKAKAKPTAKSLIVDMRKAVTYIGSNGSKMGRKSKAAMPFWSALRTTSLSLDEMEKGLKAGDKRMPKGLTNAGRSINQLNSSWNLLQGSYPNTKVNNGVRSLSSSFNLYNNNFGPAAARARQGGRMTAAETKSVRRSSQQLTAMRGRFERMGRGARPNSYEEQLVLNVLHLISQLLDTRTNNFDGYLTYLVTWEELDYSVYGCSNVLSNWYPEYYNQWETTFVSFERVDTTFYETSWSSYEEWSYSEETIEEYDEEWSESVSFTETVDEQEEADFSASLLEYDAEEATEVSEDDTALYDQEFEVADEDNELLAGDEDTGDGEVLAEDNAGDEEVMEEDDGGGDEEFLEEDDGGADGEIMEEDDGGGDEEFLEEDDGGGDEVMEEDDGGGYEEESEDDGGGYEDDGGGYEDDGGGYEE